MQGSKALHWKVLKAVDKYCKAVRNHTPEVFKFHSIQKEGEFIKEYETEFKAMVKECG